MWKYNAVFLVITVLTTSLLRWDPNTKRGGDREVEESFYIPPRAIPAEVAVLAEAAIVRGGAELKIRYLGVPRFLIGHYQGWYECASAASIGKLSNEGRQTSENAMFVSREEVKGFRKGWNDCFNYFETKLEQHSGPSSVKLGKIVVQHLPAPREMCATTFGSISSEGPKSSDSKRPGDRRDDPFEDFFDAEK